MPLAEEHSITYQTYSLRILFSMLAQDRLVKAAISFCALEDIWTGRKRDHDNQTERIRRFLERRSDIEALVAALGPAGCVDDDGIVMIEAVHIPVWMKEPAKPLANAA